MTWILVAWEKHNLCHNRAMSTMSVRIDVDTERELSTLAEHAGSRNAAVVAAIHVAYRTYLRERLRLESAALRDDPEYQADIRAAREDMGADEAW